MQVWITTNDNPYDPFEQFDLWYSFDVQKGYNTCAYVARIARTAPDLTKAETDEEIERAIDEIIETNGPAMYKKVTA